MKWPKTPKKSILTLLEKFTSNQTKMKKEPKYKTEWIIDQLISPTDNWELYQKIMESKPLPKIEKDYKYKKNPPKK